MKMTQKTAKVDQSGQAVKLRNRLPTRTRRSSTSSCRASGCGWCIHCCCWRDGSIAAVLRLARLMAQQPFARACMMRLPSLHGRRLCTACPLCQLMPAAQRRLMVTPIHCQKRQKWRNSIPSRHVHRNLPVPKRCAFENGAQWHLMFRNWSNGWAVFRFLVTCH